MTALDARAARWGLLAASWLLGLLLVATTAWSHAGVRARRADLARGQAVVVTQGLQRALEGGEGPPGAEQLEAALAANEALGLVWVGLIDGDGEVRIEAGRRSPGGELPLEPGAMVDLGGTVRLVAPPPAEPGHGGRGMGGHRGRPDAPDRHFRGGPPVLVVELVPTFAADLLDRSERALAFAVLGALLLAGASTVFWRQSVRAEAAELALSDSRRLAALGEMSAVLAHELKNPLASLKGHAQLLGELLDGRAEAPRAARVVSEAERLERLVRDLLEFARTGRIARSPVDPAAIARAAAGDTDPGRVVVHAEGAPPSWSLDADRLRQVLVNLLDNALQAAPGTRVDLEVACRAGALCFAVRDRGPGVPAADRDRIFEPFHTGRSQGSGLGLAVARRLVQLHGGQLVVEAHPDGGAVFTVRLPEA